MYFQLAPTLSAALKTYPANVSAAPYLSDESKLRPAACLHHANRVVRAAPWCKLLGWWWAATQSDRHEWAIGLDSDAFIDEHAVPVDRFAAEFLSGRPFWGAPPGEGILTLFRDPGYADGTVLDDPSDPEGACTSRYANTGFVLARAGAAAEALLRRWWDVNDPAGAVTHPFEQDAFGALWRAGLGNTTTVVCSVDRGFFIPWVPHQWVRHIPGGFKMSQRIEFIKKAAVAHGINATVFSDIITEMHYVGAVRSLDQATLSGELASRSAAEPGGGTFDVACRRQCRDEMASDPNFGVTPGLSKRIPPYVRKRRPPLTP